MTAELAGIQNYVKKGGFLIFDDFRGEHWYNFEEQIRRVFPEGRLVQLDESASRVPFVLRHSHRGDRGLLR